MSFDIDVGSEFFGYSGALQANFGMPASFSIGGRAGFSGGDWTFGARYSRTELDRILFPGEYVSAGSPRPVDVSVHQHHSLLAFDLRRDLWSHRSLNPFIDAGLTTSIFRTSLTISEPNQRHNEDVPAIDMRDIHWDRQHLLSMGAGVRINLNNLFGRGRNEAADPKAAFHCIFLEVRAGYVIGKPTSFVATGADPSLPIDGDRTSHSLYQRPIIHTSSGTLVARVTLGVQFSS